MSTSSSKTTPTKVLYPLKKHWQLGCKCSNKSELFLNWVTIVGNSVYVADLLSNWKEHLVWEAEFTFSRLEWTNQPWRTQDKRQRHGWRVREKRRGAERERETLSWIGRYIGCITFMGAWRQCGEWIAAMVTASDSYLFCTQVL